jgi:hypothetical protein
MRNLIFNLLVVLFLFLGCKNESKDTLNGDIVNNPLSASGENRNNKIPIISFEKTEFDFGKIYEGEKVSCSFKFYNKGNADLIISSATASCGCTVPNYPKGAIEPEGSGYIEVEFNTRGRSGMQTKIITIMSNTNPSKNMLTIKATIMEP